MNKFFFLFVFLFSTAPCFSLSLYPEDVKKNKEGIEYYNKNDFDNAAKSFGSLTNDTNKATSNFNEGNSLYKKGDYKNASDKFKKAISGNNIKTQVESLFNLGNSYFKEQDYASSLKSYQSALELLKSNNVKDWGIANEIRNNMQYVHNVMIDPKKQEQQKEQQDKEKKDKDNKDNKDNKEQDKGQEQQQKQDKQEQEKQDKQKQEQAQQQQNQQQSAENRQQNAKLEKDPNISPQQAKQLMNIINDTDSSLQKKFMKQNKKNDKNKNWNDKDW